MSSKKKAPNSAKGRRYSDKEKAEILAYVEKVNAEKGRGGQSAASKKYKISPLTISSWLKASGGSAKVAAPAAGGAAATSGPIGRKLQKLQNLHDQIARAEKDLAKMRAQFDALKASL